jgi:hypothetical protein
MEVSGHLHTLAALPFKERTPGTHWMGDWVEPRACLDGVAKRKIPSLPGIERRSSSPYPSHYTDWATPAPIRTGNEYIRYHRKTFLSLYGVLVFICTITWHVYFLKVFGSCPGDKQLHAVSTFFHTSSGWRWNMFDRSCKAPCYLHLQDGGNKALRNVGILPQHYTASKPRRPRLELSPPWKPQISAHVKGLLLPQPIISRRCSCH